LDITKDIPIKADRLFLDGFKIEDVNDLYNIEKSPEQHRYNFENYRPRIKNQIKEYISELTKQNSNE
jgi:hypothetical protein